jgi:peptide chain release factor subunit 1
LVEAARESLADLDLNREKRLMQRLLQEIRKSDGSLAAYGEEEVRRIVSIGAADVLLLSEGLRKRRIYLECPACGETFQMTVNEAPLSVPCKKCGGTATIVNNLDIVDDFFEQAETMGTKVQLISTDTEEGEMLLKAFGGMAALLRFSVGG